MPFIIELFSFDLYFNVEEKNVIFIAHGSGLGEFFLCKPQSMWYRVYRKSQ